MRVIHTSDIHYGMTPDRGRAWSAERAQAVADTLPGIVKACKDRSADVLLISGGLFAGRPTADDCRRVNEIFASIPQVQIAVIAGRDDPVTANSPVEGFAWADNVSYWTDSEPAMYEDGSVRILLASGELVQERSGYSYVAMGGQTRHEAAQDDSWAYPGSPQPLSVQDTGEHGYYVVDIDDVRGRVTALTFVPYADVHYVSFTIGVTPATTQRELAANLEYAIRSRGEQNIYSIRLKGMRDPACSFDLTAIKDRYRIYDITDETEPRYDFTRLYKDHPSDMIGLFIHEMNRPDMSDVGRKALYYGVNALLATREE